MPTLDIEIKQLKLTISTQICDSKSLFELLFSPFNRFFLKLDLLSRTKSGLTETESDPGYESDEILFSGKKMENMELLNRGKERPVLRAVDVSLQLPNLPDLSTPLSSLHLRDCRISRIPATLLKIIKHVSLTNLLIYMRPLFLFLKGLELDAQI